MTHDWLEELERLNAERTQGKWHCGPYCPTHGMLAQSVANGRFIAAAANHMTTLLRGYREMREALRYVYNRTSGLHGLAHVSGTALAALQSTGGKEQKEETL